MGTYLYKSKEIFHNIDRKLGPIECGPRQGMIMDFSIFGTIEYFSTTKTEYDGPGIMKKGSYLNPYVYWTVPFSEREKRKEMQIPANEPAAKEEALFREDELEAVQVRICREWHERWDDPEQRSETEKLFQNYYEAAEKGDAYAQYTIGCLSLEGTLTERNAEKAYEWIEKAAASGYRPACFKKCILLAKGTGVEKNLDEANAVYKSIGRIRNECELTLAIEAAEAGVIKACYNLGLFYFLGSLYYGELFGYWEKLPALGGQYSKEAACFWTRKAARAGDADAQWLMIKCLLIENGTPEEFDEALEYAVKLAETGYSQAAYMIFRMSALDTEKLPWGSDESIKWLKHAAEHGDSDAQLDLAISYYNGDIPEHSKEKWIEWVLKAAEQGNTDAQVDAGLGYYYGNGVDISYEEAFKWWTYAAEENNGRGLNNLACLYEDGLGVKQDYKKALECYKEAYANGYEPAKEEITRLEEEIE